MDCLTASQTDSRRSEYSKTAELDVGESDNDDDDDYVEEERRYTEELRSVVEINGGKGPPPLC